MPGYHMDTVIYCTFLVQEESDAASSFSSVSAYKPMVGSKAFNSVSHTHTRTFAYLMF